MLLQFNWDRLDITAANAVRELVNARLEEFLRSSAATRGDGVPPLESVRVTHIEWGNAPPYIELLELDDACEFSSVNSLSQDLLPWPSMSSSQHHGEGGSEQTSSAVSTARPRVWPQAPQAQQHQHQHQHQQQQQQQESGDFLESIVGPNGLFVRLHVTYGGSVRFSVAAVLRHDIHVGPAAVPVRMPLTLHLSKMDMDFNLCLNLRGSTSTVWMEPGKLSPSPITRMSVSAVFGVRRGQQQQHSQRGGGAVGMASLFEDVESDTWTHMGSSHLGSEEEEDAVFIDESAISQFVLGEIRAILQEKILYPHYVVIPLGGS